MTSIFAPIFVICVWWPPPCGKGGVVDAASTYISRPPNLILAPTTHTAAKTLGSVDTFGTCFAKRRMSAKKGRGVGKAFAPPRRHAAGCVKASTNALSSQQRVDEHDEQRKPPRFTHAFLRRFYTEHWPLGRELDEGDELKLEALEQLVLHYVGQMRNCFGGAPAFVASTLERRQQAATEEEEEEDGVPEPDSESLAALEREFTSADAREFGVALANMISPDSRDLSLDVRISILFHAIDLVESSRPKSEQHIRGLTMEEVGANIERFSQQFDKWKHHVESLTQRVKLLMLAKVCAEPEQGARVPSLGGIQEFLLGECYISVRVPNNSEQQPTRRIRVLYHSATNSYFTQKMRDDYDTLRRLGHAFPAQTARERVDWTPNAPVHECPHA